MADIDKTIANVKKIIALGMTLEDALEDNKITLDEWGKLAWKGAGLGSILKDWDELAEEINDLDEQEMETIVKTISEELDLDNDHLEEILEKGFEAIRHLVDFVRAF